MKKFQSRWIFLISILYILNINLAKSEGIYVFQIGNQLYETCKSSNPINATECSGYLQGINDALSSTNVTVSKYKYCLEPGINASQLKNAFVHYLDIHTEERQYTAASSVAKAFSEAFPCK